MRGTAWCETNVLRNLEQNVGGHGILYIHCLKQWGDASPVSPTELCPWWQSTTMTFIAKKALKCWLCVALQLISFKRMQVLTSKTPNKNLIHECSLLTFLSPGINLVQCNTVYLLTRNFENGSHSITRLTRL